MSAFEDIQRYLRDVLRDQEGDGWIASEGTCRNCGSPQRMPRAEFLEIKNSGRLPHLVGKGEEEEVIHP